MRVCACVDDVNVMGRSIWWKSVDVVFLIDFSGT